MVAKIAIFTNSVSEFEVLNIFSIFSNTEMKATFDKGNEVFGWDEFAYRNEMAIYQNWLLHSGTLKLGLKISMKSET